MIRTSFHRSDGDIFRLSFDVEVRVHTLNEETANLS